MSTTPPQATPGRHPLNTAAVIVLVVGLAVTAVLLLTPMTAAGDSCGSVLANHDPNRYLGGAACADALDARRVTAIIVAVVAGFAAAALVIATEVQKANAKERLRQASRP